MQKALHIPMWRLLPVQADAAPEYMQHLWEDDIQKPSPVLKPAVLLLLQPHPAHLWSFGNHCVRKLLLPS